MKLWIAGLALIASTAFAGALLLGPAIDNAHRYYVDYDHGDDAADGRSLARAWRHAPGDRNAAGLPARMVLRPDDVIMFAAGIRYRGALKLNGSGAEGHPVVLESTPGGRRAIIDGSDPVAAVRACRSADECGDAVNWRDLSRVEFSEPLPPNGVLFSDRGLLFAAQFPAPSDPFNADAVSEYLEVDGRDLAAGEARLPGPLAAALASAGERRLSLHIQGNMIVSRPISSLEGKVARFDPAGLRFYTDRPERIAVMDHPSLVKRPGEYGLLDGRRAAVVAMPAGAHAIFVARGRGGIDVSSQSHIVVRDLAFENMADDGASSASGVAVIKSAVGVDLRIEDNRFRSFQMPMGSGPITVNFTTGLRIINNDISQIAFGSGIRLSKDADVEIRGNSIRRIGRTGIMVMDVRHGLVAQNVVRDAKGVHGNGMSAYLDNRDVKFIANTVIESTRPITFGHASPSFDNDLVFANNLLVGAANPPDPPGVRPHAPDSRAALTSWGDGHGVLIENNIILGGQQGLELSDTDTGVEIRGNIENGDMIVKHKAFQRPGSLGYVPPSWTLSGNRMIDFDPIEAAAGAKSGVRAALQDAIRGGAGGQWTGLCAQLTIGSTTGTPYHGAIGAGLKCPATVMPPNGASAR